jgi:hypothetical protein
LLALGALWTRGAGGALNAVGSLGACSPELTSRP